MNRILIYLTIAFLAWAMVACGGNKEPQTLEGKKALLDAKKKELLAINQSINKLEAEIANLDPTAKASVRKVAVATSVLKSTEFKHFVEVQGNVEANKNILVSPQVGGTVTQIYVREGQYVKQGQTLAKLDDAVMQSTLAEAKTSLDLANIVFDKQKRLWEQEIGTEIQFLTAKNQKESIERRIATIEQQSEMSKIKAPISGSVDEIQPKVGEMVSPGFPAFRIVNNSDLSLVSNISEAYIPYIKKGDVVKINFPAIEKQVDAKVSVVGQSIDAASRTFRVEVKLPNNPMYKPNMFGAISINDRSFKDAISVPLSIIQQSEKGPFVFVAVSEGDKWIARRKNIETGLSHNGRQLVKTGLSSGDQLIVAGFKDLSDGQEIILDQESLAGN